MKVLIPWLFECWDENTSAEPRVMMSVVNREHRVLAGFGRALVELERGP